jgi:hypothetical protein
MTVKDLVSKHNFKELSIPDANRTLRGCYIGDLLSWVMGNAQADDCWITIMSNVNIVAVAALVEVDENIRQTAFDKGINILSTDKTAYEIALLLGASSLGDMS